MRMIVGLGYLRSFKSLHVVFQRCVESGDNNFIALASWITLGSSFVNYKVEIIKVFESIISKDFHTIGCHFTE